MTEFTADSLRALAESAPESEGARRAAAALLRALDSAPSAGIALLDTFAEFMEAIAETYFGKPWNEEHEFSVFARLTNDPRAWGYGSEEEIGPLRWLWETTDCWFDGERLCDAETWRQTFESWAEGQHQLVRRVTPGALGPDVFPRRES